MAYPKAIICHTPKCAGTSLHAGLIRTFGADAVRSDNGDLIWDPTSQFNIDPASFWENAAKSDVDRIVFGHSMSASITTSAERPGRR